MHEESVRTHMNEIPSDAGVRPQEMPLRRQQMQFVRCQPSGRRHAVECLVYYARAVGSPVSAVKNEANLCAMSSKRSCKRFADAPLLRTHPVEDAIAGIRAEVRAPSMIEPEALHQPIDSSNADDPAFLRYFRRIKSAEASDDGLAVSTEYLLAAI